MQPYFKTNKALWDAKTPIHLQSKMYDMDAFLGGKSSLDTIITNQLEDVTDKKVLHLQCHFGQDSLSLARMGAKVTGVDFSGIAIDTARQLNKQLRLDAAFVECNIYDLEQHLSERDFDIVFASYGFLPWLPDFKRWAAIAHSYLREGGRIYLTEFHPTLNMFDWENPKPRYDYFYNQTPYEETVQGTYADKDADISGKEYFWNYSIHEVMQPLLSLGMRLTFFEEYDYSPYDLFGDTITPEAGKYRLPGVDCRFPYVWSMVWEG